MVQDLAGILAADLRNKHGPDIEAISTLVAVHWIRYRSLPEGPGQDDLQSCLTWSRKLLPVAPHLVPEPIRARLSTAGTLARDPSNIAEEVTARGTLLYENYGETGNIAQLDAAIGLYRDALATTPVAHPARPRNLSNLGTALKARFDRTERPDDVDEAIALFRDAVSATALGHRDQPEYLSNLGAALITRFRRTAQMADLDEGHRAFRDAVSATPTGHPGRPLYLSNLGVTLRTHFEWTGQLDDPDEPITLLRAAVAATPAGDLTPPSFLSNLASELESRFERTGELADLNEAIATNRQVVDTWTDHPDHPDRPGWLSNLGIELRTRFKHTGQLDDLSEAIATSRQAVDTTPRDHPYRPRYLSSLGVALRIRGERTGQLDDLNEAIAVSQEAVDVTPIDHPDRPERLSSLAAARGIRFARSGNPGDLDEAIILFRIAVSATPYDHVARLLFLSNLGQTLTTRMERTGQSADLDEVIAIGRETVAAIHADHVHRPTMLSNLAAALRTRFARTGKPGDLDEAITLSQEAVTVTPVGHPGRPERLSSLGSARAIRFEQNGQLDDLHEAIIVLQEAVDAISEEHPERPGCLSDLGNALRIRFERTGRPDDLDEAIAAAREAVAATPTDHPSLPSLLTNLAVVLRLRTGRPEDLDEAIGIGRAAVATAPTDHPDLPSMLTNLANVLRDRHGRTRQLDGLNDLEEAIAAGRKAVATTLTDHPHRPLHLVSLGFGLRTRFECTGQLSDLTGAIEVCQEAARTLTASPQRRLIAAREWGRCSVLAGDVRTAVQAYATGIELLPLVVWHGLDQATREHHLRDATGLVAEAAAAAVMAGDPVRAVELLEAGRAQLWTQALHLRHDQSALQSRDPLLAASLQTSRRILNSSFGGSMGDWDAPGSEGLDQRGLPEQLEARRRAARDWDAVVDQVRRLEGFEHFLRPVPFAELRLAAADGPVVIVNISEQGSHALIILPQTGQDLSAAVQVVNLPEMALDALLEHINALLAAQNRALDPSMDEKTFENDRQAVFDVLAWTWRTITEPVLTALGHTATPRANIEDWPRVWWCPTGLAAVLPLHAAGDHPRTHIAYASMGESAAIADSVAGRVVSSYTPTLTALTRAHARSAPAQVRQLAVGVVDAPGQRHLSAVPKELDVLTNHLAIPEQATHLLGAQATKQAVLKALPEYSWLHLSCHSVQDPIDASRSAFFLHDHPLTLADLAAVDLPDADLAYLAACQTATGDLRLLDEALHLAAALQLIGYRHVLATQWSIADAVAPAMADTIYAHLAHPDPHHRDPADSPLANRAAHALHHAVTRLRQDYPEEPLLWAPYIHLGP